MERFTRCAPGLSGAARRTLRTNLRFTGRLVVPHLYPADAPLPRDRAKQPYSAAEIGGFLALAAAQPTAGAAGARGRAGLPRRGRRADPRRPARRPRQRRRAALRRGRRHRVRRPGARRTRPRPLPPATAGRRPRAAGDGLVCGGSENGRRNLTNRLVWPPWTAGAGSRGWTPPGCVPPGWPTAGGSCWGWRRS